MAVPRLSGIVKRTFWLTSKTLQAMHASSFSGNSANRCSFNETSVTEPRKASAATRASPICVDRIPLFADKSSLPLLRASSTARCTGETAACGAPAPEAAGVSSLAAELLLAIDAGVLLPLLLPHAPICENNEAAAGQTNRKSDCRCSSHLRGMHTRDTNVGSCSQKAAHFAFNTVQPSCTVSFDAQIFDSVATPFNTRHIRRAKASIIPFIHEGQKRENDVTRASRQTSTVASKLCVCYASILPAFTATLPSGSRQPSMAFEAHQCGTGVTVWPPRPSAELTHPAYHRFPTVASCHLCRRGPPGAPWISWGPQSHPHQ